MKTSKTIKALMLFSLTMSTSIATTFAQWHTPFEKVEKNEEGKRMYYNPNPKFGRSSLSIGYGFMPVSSTDWFSHAVFDSKISEDKKFKSHNTSNIGVVSFAYSNQLNPWLELVIPLSYSYASGYFPDLKIQGYDNTYYESFVTIMPSVKISWFYNDLMHFYSRAGLGVAIANRYERFQAGMNGKMAFMWQVSPIGFEVGRRVAFYIEAGYGQSGVVNAGVKFRFNKADYKPDGTRREVKSWYDSYVR